MTEDNPQITELDLLAYADGRLDGDPRHKERVQAYLKRNPDEADRVNSYIAQNELIERHYSIVLEEPIPERLMRTLASYSENRLPPSLLSKLAATVLLCSAITGFGGWWVGLKADKTDTSIPAFVNQALAGYDTQASHGKAMTEMPLPSNSIAVIEQASDRINLGVRISNLIPKGFTVRNKRIIEAAGEETLRLDFAAPGGQVLSLFLGARGWSRAPETSVAEKGDTSAVYWHDGPLSFGLVSRMSRKEVLRIAETIRHSARFRRKVLDQPLPPNTGQGLAAKDPMPLDLLPKVAPAIVNDL